MIHPLVQACLEVARAGYERRNDLYPQVFLKDYRKLAEYLLNGSITDHAFKIKTPKSDVLKEKRIVLSFGSGVDSYCALINALRRGYEVSLCYVNYRQPYAEAEYRVFEEIRRTWLFPTATTAFSADLNKFREEGKINFYKEHISLIQSSEDAKGLDWESYIIPARNLVLASIASQYAGRIWIVATKRIHESVGTPDKTAVFYRMASSMFTEFYGRRIIVESPFLHQSKAEVVQEYLEWGGSLETLSNTFSCYAPKELRTINKDLVTGITTWKPCGICFACFKRHRLFAVKYGRPDLCNFYQDPTSAPRYNMYMERELMKGREV